MPGFPKKPQNGGPRRSRNVTPTEKQLAYTDLRTEPGTTDKIAAREAGYKGRPAVVVADLERKAFNGVVAEAFEKAGVTLETIATKVAGLMNAEEEKPFVTRKGTVVYAKPAALADIQLKATVTAADLLGLSSKARLAAVEEGKPGGDGVNILVLAQQFEHLPDTDLREAMQLMLVGQFDNSRFGRAVPADVVTVDGKEVKNNDN